MKKQILRKVTATGLFFLLAAAYVSAADLAVNIKNQFKAGGKAFPAGQYKISAKRGLTDHLLTIRNMDTGTESLVKFITRISPRDKYKGSVVFDKVGDEYYLSEVYFPGEDGFHLQGAPGEHTHVSPPASVSK